MCIVLGAFGEYPPVVSLQPLLLTLLLKVDMDSEQKRSYSSNVVQSTLIQFT